MFAWLLRSQNPTYTCNVVLDYQYQYWSPRYNDNIVAVMLISISDGEVMRYGAIISTSNKVTEKIVTITCDGALLWMMGFCSTEEL